MTSRQPAGWLGRTITRGARILVVAVLGGTSLMAQGGPMPPEPPAADELSPLPLALLVGRSTIVDIGTPITRVSLTSPDIADVLVTSTQQLLVNGKAPGAISMFVWEQSGALRRYEVVVQRDLAALQQQLGQLFPGQTITARSNGSQIVLSGAVPDEAMIERAVNVAAGFAGSADNVVSVLTLQQAPRTRQVLLQVRFAEVSRSALTELGLGLFTSPLGVNNTLGRVTTQQFSAPGFEDLEWTKESLEFGSRVTGASGGFSFSDFLNLFIFSQRYDLGLALRALNTRGLFESLAEPNLVAESGKEASFLAGGEFPIPVAQGSGANLAISVQFKEFGIRLSFTPTVIGDRVHLKVAPEVSMLDFNNAVFLQGFRIPALTTRRTQTELELMDGQTFAIAGLMNNSMNESMQKIPGIGDIPILGYLFRSRAARKEQTELVVMITPHILPDNSVGATGTLPSLPEPFLPPVPARDLVPPPPPAFPYPATPGASNVAPEPTPAPRPLTADERRALERAARAEREARDREAREARQRLEAERRAQEAERRRVEAAARAQARRDAEEARRTAEAARKQAEQQRREEADARRRAEQDAKRLAEQARRDAEAERKQQAAVAGAEARLRAAEAAYRAELERTSNAAR